jgi:hypothetical protein
MSSVELPLELWDGCISYFQEDKHTLALASLVCKRWCHYARTLLFHEIKLYIVHSIERTQEFLHILSAPGLACTFRHAVRTLLIYEFDDPFHSIRHPKRFFQRTLKSFQLLHNLSDFRVFHKFWSVDHGTELASGGGLCMDSLKQLIFSHGVVRDLSLLSKCMTNLPSLEELILNVEVFGAHEEEPPLHLLPPSLTRLVMKIRTPATGPGQNRLYEWMEMSSLQRLRYLWVNPTRHGFRALGRALLSVRKTLKELVVRPEFRDNDAHGPGVLAEEIVQFGEG